MGCNRNKHNIGYLKVVLSMLSQWIVMDGDGGVWLIDGIEMDGMQPANVETWSDLTMKFNDLTIINN